MLELTHQKEDTCIYTDIIAGNKMTTNSGEYCFLLQPMTEEELVLARKLEEIEWQEKLTDGIISQIFAVKLHISISLYFPISPVVCRLGCASLIRTMIINVPPTSTLSPSKYTPRVIYVLFTASGEPSFDNS